MGFQGGAAFCKLEEDQICLLLCLVGSACRGHGHGQPDHWEEPNAVRGEAL